MANDNKVNFGLKNVHYAVLTEGATPTWSTPVAVPGAVSLSLSQEGGRENFYADNVAYFVTNSNNGFSGDLEMALVPDQMMQDIWGFDLDSAGVLFEDANVEPKPFALMFEIDGNENPTKYVFYRCFADRPNLDAQTTEENKTPRTQTLSINCLPMAGGDMEGKVRAKTTAETTAEVLNAWYTAVYTG